MGFCLEVSGDFACFTRPEMRVERVSYDVITPSAARNIFQAILWKPSIEWHVDRIEVLNPIRWMNIGRNEVGAVISESAVKGAINKGSGRLQLFVEKERQQRSSLILRDVRYRIHAHFKLTPKAGSGETPEKFLSMFLRRSRKGQCFRQPYLGCKEFSADFQFIEPHQPMADTIQDSKDLGWMFYDYDYSEDPPSPRFFRARMTNGVVEIPQSNSSEIRG